MSTSLTLKEDSTFHFRHFWNRTDSNSGKWKMSGDTVILYGYLERGPRIDTLSGEEYDVAGKDSIEIIFIDKYRSVPCPVQFVVNGKCLPWQASGQPPCESYRIPRQEITYIFLPYRYQIYMVKNSNADKIVIRYNPLRFIVPNRVVEFKRSLIKGDELTPIECDGKPSSFIRLTRE
jgi:hypothetical protein